jgi:hypothetical protein
MTLTYPHEGPCVDTRAGVLTTPESFKMSIPCARQLSSKSQHRPHALRDALLTQKVNSQCKAVAFKNQHRPHWRSKVKTAPTGGFKSQHRPHRRFQKSRPPPQAVSKVKTAPTGGFKSQDRPHRRFQKSTPPPQAVCKRSTTFYCLAWDGGGGEEVMLGLGFLMSEVPLYEELSLFLASTPHILSVIPTTSLQVMPVRVHLP